MQIKRFNQFKIEDTLYVFDFDDTIVDTPRFEELIIQLIKEDVTLKSLLDMSLKFVKKGVKDLKIDNGRLYIEDPKQEIPVKGNWVRKKNNHLYLVAPDKFYFTDFSLPTGTTELSKLYNQVKNKSIVTGRSEQMRDKVIDKLYEFGLEFPNHGLYCFPTNDSNSDKVATWKGKTIVEIAKKTGYKKIKFYDDKSKWVNKVTQIVKSELPEIDFEGIKVKS
jgi:hypothetical protein